MQNVASVAAPLSPAALAEAVAAETRILLDPAIGFGTLYQAVHRLHALFVEITGLHARNETRAEFRAETRLPCGRAISMKHAAHCLLEFQRTAVFLRGIYQALTTLQLRFPGQTLDVVYAGCGPYATLITPLLPLLRDLPLRLTLIDIHPQALAMAGAIHTAMGFSAPELCAGDAATYQHPPGRTLHLVITETMRRALEGETQVAVTAQLVRQLHRDGVLVPEAIELKTFHKWHRYGEDEAAPAQIRVPLAWRLRVDRAFLSALDREALQHETDYSVPCGAIELPAVGLNRHSLGVQTQITTFGEHQLHDHHCSLNEVVTLAARHFDTPGTTLATRLYITGRPGLHIQGLKRERV